jgi:hypothetical protein
MRAIAVLALATLAAVRALAADENKDIELIPGEIQNQAPPSAPSTAPPPPTTVSQGRFYLEDAITAWGTRNLVVPIPAPVQHWQNRTSFDARNEWHLSPEVSVVLSDRFNLFEESDLTFPSHATYRNDFREGYVSWEPAPQYFLEAGRINVKNGIALGFNPTDFFKTRTLVAQASLDPSVLREDRLGTAIVRGQRVFEGGSVSAAFAPKLVSPTPIPLVFPPSNDPGFNRTNADNRLLLTGSYELVGDLAPELLFYRQSSETRIGANLSHGIGNAIIAYAEWAGGQQPTLADAALAFGKETGTLPPAAPNLLGAGNDKTFRNDVAVGASYTTENRITFNLEYHYHQAGFDRDDWRRWFAIGGANPSSLPITGALWYDRLYASDQQEPLPRHEIFLRADWTDAFVTDLELTAFAFVDLYDGSILTQASASYYLSRSWTIAALASANIGGARSERGSFPQAESVILQLVRYF